MEGYDAYLICENGHGINSSYYKRPNFNKKFCTYCGASTLKACQGCGNDIEGEYNYKNLVDLTSGLTPVPTICKHCGISFPWKESIDNKQNQNKEISKLLALENIFNRFHLVTKQIRKRYNDRVKMDIQDEYDVQDLLHALLSIYYDDIRTEEWNPSYAGGSSRSDFLLKQEGIVIEVKKTRETLKTRQLGEQLIVDIKKYETHPDCKTLYCFVYDPEGYINNPRGIENDLNDSNNEINVIVKIVP